MINKKRILLVFLVIVILSPLALSVDNYDDVLLVTNNLSSISMQIGEYFVQQRSIIYWVNISLDPAYYGEVVSYDPIFNNSIRTPIENYITKYI